MCIFNFISSRKEPSKKLIKSLIILYWLVVCHANISRFSALDEFIVQYRAIRNGAASIIGSTSGDPSNMLRARKLGMLQEPVPISTPFPCNTSQFRSVERPNNVHRVRPGDIDVVGALGDSLTAGTGVVATNLLQILIENRGLSWSIGGQGNWNEIFTLPNVLKEFNPGLIGYARGDALSTDKKSQFNVAEPSAVSSDLPYMTQVLINRMKLDHRVDVEKQWKLVTIMIGANDMCSMMCNYKEPRDALRFQREYLMTSLRLIRDNLPRTIVNVVSSPNVRAVLDLNDKRECQFLHTFECTCLFLAQYQKDRIQFLRIANELQSVDEEIASLEEFQTNDFSVVYQPFITNYTVPKNYSYYSYDCFHWSQRLHAEVANSLWNNMLEPKGKKSRQITRLFDKLLCPTEQNPYIFT